MLFLFFFLIRLESFAGNRSAIKGIKIFFAELGLFYESDQYRKITNLDERYRSRIKFTLDFVEKKKRHPLFSDAFEMIESDLFSKE